MDVCVWGGGGVGPKDVDATLDPFAIVRHRGIHVR